MKKDFINNFSVGQIVYLRTDIEQKTRIIKEILISNSVQYKLGCADVESWHYEFEMSLEKDILKTM